MYLSIVVSSSLLCVYMCSFFFVLCVCVCVFFFQRYALYWFMCRSIGSIYGSNVTFDCFDCFDSSCRHIKLSFLDVFIFIPPLFHSCIKIVGQFMEKKNGRLIQSLKNYFTQAN